MKKTLILLIFASVNLTSCKTSFSNNQTQTAMVTETKSTENLTLAAVERFNAAFNRHDVDAVMNAMTEDCIFENTNPQPDGTRLVGAVDVRA